MGLSAVLSEPLAIYHHLHGSEPLDIFVLVAGILCCIVSSFSAAVFCFISGLILERLSGDVQWNEINNILSALVILGFGTGLLSWCNLFLWDVIAEKQSFIFRRNDIKTLLANDIGLFPEIYLSGDQLVSQVDSTSDAMNHGMKAVGSAVGALFTSLSCLAISLYSSWTFTVIVIVAYVTVLIVWRLITYTACCCVGDNNSEENRVRNELNRLMLDMVKKIRTVIILNIQGEMKKKILNLIDESSRVNIKGAVWIGLRRGMPYTVSLFVYGICLLYSINVIAYQLVLGCDGDCISGGTVITVLFSFVVCISALYSLPLHITSIYEAAAHIAAAAAFSHPLLHPPPCPTPTSPLHLQTLSDSRTKMELALKGVYSPRPGGELWDILGSCDQECSGAITAACCSLDSAENTLSLPLPLPDNVSVNAPVPASAFASVSFKALSPSVRNMGFMQKETETEGEAEQEGEGEREERENRTARGIDNGRWNNGMDPGSQIPQLEVGSEMVSKDSGGVVLKTRGVSEEAVSRVAAIRSASVSALSRIGEESPTGSDDVINGWGFGEEGRGSYGVYSTASTASNTPTESRSRSNSDTPLFALVNPNRMAFALPSASTSSKTLTPSRSPHASQKEKHRHHSASPPYIDLNGVGFIDSEDLDMEMEMKEHTHDVDEDHGLKSRIWQLIKKRSVSFVFGLFGAALVGLVPPLWGFLLADFETQFYAQNPFEMRKTSRLLFFKFIALGFISCVGYFTETFCMNRIGQKIAQELRSKILLRLLKRHVSYFDLPENSPFSLVQQSDFDPDVIHQASGQALSNGVQAFVTVTLSLLIACNATWEITLLFLAALPLNYLAALWKKMQSGTQSPRSFLNFDIRYLTEQSIVEKYRDRDRDREREKKMRMGMGMGIDSWSRQGVSVESKALLSRALSNVRTVRAYSLQEEVVTSYTELCESERRLLPSHRVRLGAAHGLCLAMKPLTHALLFWLGSYLITSGRATFSSVMTAVNVLLLGTLGALHALKGSVTYSEGLAAAARVFRCIESEGDSEHGLEADSDHNDDSEEHHTHTLRKGAEGGPPCGPLEGSFELRNIVFQYPIYVSYAPSSSPSSPHHPTNSSPFTLIVESLAVSNGEYLAIVGPTGSGKSTLLLLLLRLYEPSDGLVFWDGEDSRNLDPSWLRSNIGHVEKASQFFSGTIAENINRGKSGDRVSAIVSPRPTSPRPRLTSSPRPIASVSAAGTGAVTPSAVRAARNKNTATVCSGSATHQSIFSALLHAARTVSVSVNVSTVSAVEMADLSPPSPSSPSSSSRLSVLADCSSVSPDVLDAAAEAGAHDFIAHLEKGYETPFCREESGGEADKSEGETQREGGGEVLSTGQRQLLGIARSLIRRPPVLLLDDVAAVLEGEEQAAVEATMRDLKNVRSSEGSTVVTSSRLSSVWHADRIVVLVAGRIAQQGTHSQLMDVPGWYADQWAKELMSHNS